MQQPLDLPARDLPARLKARAPRAASATSSFLGRLTVSQKLGMAASAFTLPIAALLFIAVRSEVADLTFSQREQAGAAAMQPFMSAQDRLFDFVGAVSGTPAQPADPDEAPAPAQTPAQASAAVLSALSDLEGAARRAGLDASADAFVTVRGRWQDVQATLEGADPSVLASSFAQLSTEQLLPALTTLLDDSNLILDPDTNTYFTMQGTLSQLPEVYARLATLKLLVGAYGAAEGQSFQRLLLEPQIREQAVRASSALDNAVRSMERAVQDDASLRPTLGEAATSLTRVRDLLDSAATTDSVEKFVRRTSSAQLAEAGTAVRAGMGVGTRDMTRLLDQRVSGIRTRMLLELLGATLVTLLAAALLFAVARAIARPLSQLSDAAQKLSQGDLSVSVPVTTQDEVGVLARTFNGAVSQLRENDERVRRDRAEAEQLQQHIGQFLDVTMDIADGDLTRRGVVTEDVLGNVVDSINVMTEELGAILREVRAASDQVNQGSGTMLSTTLQISQGTELTAEEAQEAARRALEMGAQIERMAHSAQTSAETAGQALLASQQGQQAVQTTLEGMSAIRESSQAAAERIAALSQRSEEIREIAEAITHIASQTNLLALHASIEAAGAGEAGTRFSVVAQEVRELADTSGQATARIGAIVQSIQKDIAEVVRSMQDNAQAVERGHADASSAGARLGEIGELVQHSAQLAQDISQRSREQVQGAARMGQAVQEIASVAQTSQQSVQQGRAAAQQLRALSEQLSAGLSRFRLPS